MNIYMLLDRSSSMASNWDETLGAINSYIAELTGKTGFKRSKATLATFDTYRNLDFDVIRDSVPLVDWSPITNADAVPRGMTPLFDAIGKLNGIVNKANPKKATVVVITDGAENASCKINREGARDILDSFKEKGYDVVFIGADFDAFGQAHSVGVGYGMTLNMSAGNYAEAMRGLADKTQYYSHTGKARDWLESERTAAVGGDS